MERVTCRQKETGLSEKEWVSVTELIVYLFLLDVGSRNA